MEILKKQYLAIIWASFVLVMCFMPLREGPKVEGFFFAGFDKIVHTGFLFVLTILLFHGELKQHVYYAYSFPLVMKIILLTMLFGGGIELLQWKVFTYRSGDWWDFFCDMVGVGMGVFSYLLLQKTRPDVL